MHPGWLRCSSVTYLAVCSLVAPCQPGASTTIFSRLPRSRAQSLDAGALFAHNPAMPTGPKLRAEQAHEPFRIVLVDPEIPGNTGAAARTAAATQSALHLVGKLGFRIDEQSVRRAGLDYWHLVDLHRHEALGDFQVAHPGSRLHLFSSGAKRSYLDVAFQPGDALVFGKESTGLDRALLEAHPDAVVGIPTLGAVRSLNLSNAVAIVVYEALRQTGALDRTFVEEDSGPR